MFKERLLREALKAYAGEHVLERVLALGESALQLNNGRERMAVMYVIAATNRRVFEELGPAQAREQKIRFLSITQEEVEAAGGRIADYLGDDAIVYFPAPRGDAACAAAAAQCARRIVERSLDAVQPERPPMLLPMIGLDLGFVFIGNFGTPQRMKFTVQGDVVNAAYEIAGCCKKFQATILMSEVMAGLAAAPGTAPEGYVGDAVTKLAGAMKLYVPVEVDFAAVLGERLEQG
ncbi:MAG TPA: adenylate/guanylate cyclase domain-containing protein [Burkholderiales bacterium]